MDNLKMGQFILELRKAKGLTQKELAGKLHVTDKAVSKWERGISCPDITLLPELAEALGVTTGELLNGEKIKQDVVNKGVSVDNALQYAEKAAKGRMKLWQNVFALLFTAILLLGMIVCGICNWAISGAFTWSLYPISAIIYAWFVLFPVIKWDKRGIVWSLTAITILTIPFLYVLSILVEGPDGIMLVGGSVTIIVASYLWCVFGVFHKCKARKLLATAIALLLSVPMCILINVVLSRILNIPVFDVWDMLDFAIMIIAGGAFLVADYVTGKRECR